jgi:hypothetical protein
MLESHFGWVTSQPTGKPSTLTKVRRFSPAIVRCHHIGFGAIAALLAISPGLAFGQACPTPAVADNASCTVAPGTVTNVTPAGAVGYRAINGGQITADGVTEKPRCGKYHRRIAESGGTISFNGSTLATTATTTATSAGQIGLWATGLGSAVNGTGATITMGPPNGTTITSNMRGAISDNGASIVLFNSTIRMLGGGTGLNNHALVATGTGSAVSFLGGVIETRSRTSYGVFAEDGGIATLRNGAQVSTTGAGTAAMAS